jgi:hypothetical protein
VAAAAAAAAVMTAVADQKQGSSSSDGLTGTCKQGQSGRFPRSRLEAAYAQPNQPLRRELRTKIILIF